MSLEKITVDRRKHRREKKKLDKGEHSADLPIVNEIYSSSELLEMAEGKDYECYQLDLLEAFFLVFALNALEISDTSQKVMSISECWSRFAFYYSCRSYHGLESTIDPPFNLFSAHYAAYHYYRSLGWVPKNGAKFGVDFVLYQTGPKFRHADFAVVVLPHRLQDNKDNKDNKDNNHTWKWLLGLNRVCTQVKKTLILCYVTVPANNEATFSKTLLKNYKIQEIILKRWSAEKNR
ncbi:tRNA intron endonuclease [Spinellus fusiger]|nr:tRNA intron endonuclease [Spinellus fusiger]